MHIRRATRLDAAALAAFKCVTPGQNYTRVVQRGIRTGVAPIIGGTEPDEDPTAPLEALVATDEDLLVGVVAFRVSGDIGHLLLLGVLRSHRDRGIGTELMRLAFDVCSARGATEISYEVHRNNSVMQEVSTKLGTPGVKDPADGEMLLSAYRVGPTDGESQMPDGPVDNAQLEALLVAGLDGPLLPQLLGVVRVPAELRRRMGERPWPGLVVSGRITSGEHAGEVAAWLCAEPRVSDGPDAGNIGPVLALNDSARRVSDFGLLAKPGGTLWEAKTAVEGAGLVDSAILACP